MTARAVFLWHLHQPEYRDPQTGQPLLPWVRLHATRAYNDMAARKVMPGTIDGRVDGTPDVGSPWSWDPASAKYGHSFMKRFQAWKSRASP